MSIRLSIVLSQSAGGTAMQQDMEGDLVARLIGMPGMDLCLVGPLERSTQDSTDRLVLEGLQGDFALLTWHAAEAVSELMRQAGQVGERVPHALDPHAVDSLAAKGEEKSRAEAVAKRRFYLVELHGKTSAQVVAGLQQILASRRTKTVAIGTLPTPLPIAKLAQPTAATLPDRVPIPRPAEPAVPTKSAVVPDSSTPLERDEWDDLVDDLNESNI